MPLIGEPDETSGYIGRIIKMTSGSSEESRVQAPSRRALCRTRTGDPFLTMEVLYQLS